MRRSMGSYVVLSVLGTFGTLVMGLIAFRILASFATPPAEAKQSEPTLRVNAVKVEPENVQSALTEFGVARSLDVVPIAPEVGGRIVKVHDRLDVGEVIPANEVLVQIDPRDYESRKAQAEAEVSRLESSIQRIRTEWTNDQDRLKTLARSKDLSEAEFLRLKELLEKDEVGTRSGVEAAERQFNTAMDAVDQMQRALNVYPITIKEQESLLASARANLAQAVTDLERTTIRVPFDARVREKTVETGQFVTPGSPILTLADDSMLEISVSLDSREAQRWLPFKAGAPLKDTAWFGDLEPVECTVRWTDGSGDQTWKGHLYRVERFENDTRKVTVAVRVSGVEARSENGGLPLVDGMFCSVEIPGKTMDGVYALPQWAVSYDGDVDKGHVYISQDDRLKRVPVQVARRVRDTTYIESGLNPGDTVVVTRLVNPLENTLLDIDWGVPEIAAEESEDTAQ